MVAVDPDYERMGGKVETKDMYWWPDRTWRRVQVCRPEFGRLVPGTDPDRQLEPERLPGDGIMGMRAVRSGSNVPAIHTYLHQHGPATAAQIAVALGIEALAWSPKPCERVGRCSARRARRKRKPANGPICGRQSNGCSRRR